jgi:hypothetical protein
MSKDLKFWIDELIKPRTELGNLPVCPFAKGVNFDIVQSNGEDIIPPSEDFELVVYMLPEDITVDQINYLSEKYNQQYPDIIFLPDHKDRKTFINGVQTNNGKHNLLLCQLRSRLKIARDRLKKSNYYSYWTEDYLKEILDH